MCILWRKYRMNPEKMREEEIAGSVHIRLAEPLNNIELAVYPKLFGKLAVYAQKDGWTSIVEFASDLLKKHLKHLGCEDVLNGLEKYTQEHHITTIEGAALNILANALTIIMLREHLSLIKKRKRR